MPDAVTRAISLAGIKSQLQREIKRATSSLVLQTHEPSPVRIADI
jgi:hypothetical protein